MTKLLNNLISKKHLTRELLSIVALLLLMTLTSKALFAPGFFRTIDDVTTVRIDQMARELSRPRLLDNFPVRLLGELAHGFGYPLFVFYAPLPYYVGAVSIFFLGLNPIIATKLVYVLPVFFGALFFFLVARQKMNLSASVLATTLFLVFPYRSYNMYVRGGVGESWAIGFIPLVFLGISLLKKTKIAGSIIMAIGIFSVIISHNLVAIQLLVLLVCYGVIFHLKQIKYWTSVLLGFGLAAFYVIPMVSYLTIIRVLTTSPNSGKIISTLEPINHIFKSTYPFISGTKYSAIFTYLLFISLFFLLIRNKKSISSAIKNELIFWLSSSFFLIFLLIQSSMFLWVISLPITQILQFSWRVLSLLSFVIPFTIGLVFNHISRTFARVLLFVIAFFSIIYLTPTFEPEKYSFFYEYHAEDTGVCATTTWEDEYLPKTVADCASNPRPFIEAGDTLLKIDTESPNFISGRSESVEPVRIQINKYLFPGWTALVDGKSTRLEPSEIVSGTASFIVPSGTHEFEVKYSKTKLMMLADITSLSSLIIISFLLTQVILKSLKRK